VEAARHELRADWPPLSAADVQLVWEHGAAVAAGAVCQAALVPHHLSLGTPLPCPSMPLKGMYLMPGSMLL